MNKSKEGMQLKKELLLFCSKEETWALRIIGPCWTDKSYFQKAFMRTHWPWMQSLYPRVHINAASWSQKKIYSMKSLHEPMLFIEFRDQCSPSHQWADQAFPISEAHFPYQREESYTVNRKELRLVKSGKWYCTMLLLQQVQKSSSENLGEK